MRSRNIALLVGLFLASVSLRPQLVGIGPLIPRIQDDLDVSHAVAGLLGTIPVLGMGVFAPLGLVIGARVGTRVGVTACLAAIGAFGLARLAVPHAAAVILLTVGVGIGLGAAQGLMPVVVKERFASRPAFATGVYATGINVGAGVAAASAVPLADGLGSWRWPLAVFSAVTVALVAVWWWITRREPDDRPATRAVPRLPWRSRLGWLLVALYGLMALQFYGVQAWLADAYVERGWSESSAGGLVALLNVASLATTLTIPWLADRIGSRRQYLTGLGAAAALATVGLAALPGGAWGWAALGGAAYGAMLPLVLTLPLDAGGTPAAAGGYAAMMLGVGYSIGAVSPLGLGAVRDLAGSYDATLWLIAGDSCVFVLIASLFTARRLAHEHMQESRPAP